MILLLLLLQKFIMRTVSLIKHSSPKNESKAQKVRQLIEGMIETKSLEFTAKSQQCGTFSLSAGRLFQTFGADDEKAREPTAVLIRGVCRMRVPIFILSIYVTSLVTQCEKVDTN